MHLCNAHFFFLEVLCLFACVFFEDRVWLYSLLNQGGRFLRVLFLWVQGADPSNPYFLWAFTCCSHTSPIPLHTRVAMTLRAFLPGLSCRICFGHSFIHIFCHLPLPYNVASLFRLRLWLTAIISSCEVYYAMGQRWLYPAVQWYVGFFLAFRNLLLSLMHMGFLWWAQKRYCCLDPTCFMLSGLWWSSAAACDVTRASVSSCLFSFWVLLFLIVKEAFHIVNTGPS